MAARNPHNGLKGFTALELLITLAVATLLSLIALPGLGDYARDKRMDAAMTRLHTDLNLARREAVSRNAVVLVCPGNPDTGCAEAARWEAGWIVFADRNADRIWQQDEPLLRTASAREHVRITSAAARDRIRFSPAGAAPASNASIVFCDDRGLANGQKLVLSNTGRIRRDTLSDADSPRCGA